MPEQIDRETYLQRIYDYINFLVLTGALTREQGVSILRFAETGAEKWSQREKLPYWKEINTTPWEWYQITNELREKVYKARQTEEATMRQTWMQKLGTEATKREYLPTLKEYLDYGVQKRDITPVQRHEAYTQEAQMIEQGVPVQNLPYFSKLQEWMQYKGEAEKAKQLGEYWASKRETARAEARYRTALEEPEAGLATRDKERQIQEITGETPLQLREQFRTEVK